jgi:hypothetical protein
VGGGRPVLGGLDFGVNTKRKIRKETIIWNRTGKQAMYSEHRKVRVKQKYAGNLKQSIQK